MEASRESNPAPLSGWLPLPCRYPALTVCGMRGIDRALRARIPCTGGANVGPNPGL